MKKFISIALSALMATSLFGCSSNTSTTTTSSTADDTKTYKVAVV